VTWEVSGPLDIPICPSHDHATEVQTMLWASTVLNPKGVPWVAHGLWESHG
jgi:hypothetical protein